MNSPVIKSALDDPPLPREAKAGFDECAMIFELLNADKSTGVMIDVGAHFGSSLIPFAKAGWTVFAFEPDAANRRTLEAAAHRDPATFSKVTISSAAISDAAREDVPLFTSPVSTGISGLNAFHETHSEAERVSTTTLNDVVEAHGLDVVDFLKIDVEGHEMSVLRGLDLDNVKPRAILAEFEDAKTRPQGYASGDLARLFEDAGYVVFVSEWHPIERYGIRHSWARVRRWPCDIPADAWGNFIAVLEKPADALLERSVRIGVEAGRPAAAITRGRSLAKRILGRLRRLF